MFTSTQNEIYRLTHVSNAKRINIIIKNISLRAENDEPITIAIASIFVGDCMRSVN